MNNPLVQPSPKITPPPSTFNYLKSQITTRSLSFISHHHPTLLDLAHSGTLVVVPKEEFGPVPTWRAESGFVEPDEIWVIGTTHLGKGCGEDVESVVREVGPESVVVDLCRSRHVVSKTVSLLLRNRVGFDPLTSPHIGGDARATYHVGVGVSPVIPSDWNKTPRQPTKDLLALLRVGYPGRSVQQVVFQVYIRSSVYRAGIMYASDEGAGERGKQMNSNMFSLSGSEFFGAVNRSLNLGKKQNTHPCSKAVDVEHGSSPYLGGQTALALRLLFAFFSSKVSSDVDRPFGDEFRAARKVAEEVGAQVVLGDRPVEITLERAWNSLRWFEKLNLIGAIVRGITSKSDASAASLKESGKDVSPFELYEQLSLTFPSLLQPLVHERDTVKLLTLLSPYHYLAWSLKRSKAVNHNKRVVGVIGKGHMNGVIYALISDLGDLRFRDLVGQRSSNVTLKLKLPYITGSSTQFSAPTTGKHHQAVDAEKTQKQAKITPIPISNPKP
ncbi:hypothetical protein AKJ16_DCAP19546 [Drosera capensis]